MPGIFVSYRRRDTAGHAGRVFDRLRDHFGTRQVFRDVNYLKGGEDFVEALARAVDTCKVFIVVIGCDWFDTRDDEGRRRLEDPHDFIRLEVETALRRKVLVVPVLVEGATMRGADDLPEPLRPLGRLQAIELSDHRWDFDIQELLTRIEEVIGRPGQRRKRFAVLATATMLLLAGVATSGTWRPLLPFADAPQKVVASSPPVVSSPDNPPSPNVAKDVGRNGSEPSLRPADEHRSKAEDPKTSSIGKSNESPKSNDPAKSNEPPKSNESSTSNESKSNDMPKSNDTSKSNDSPKSSEPPNSNEPPKSNDAANSNEAPRPKPNEPPKPAVSTVTVPELRGESIRNVFPRMQDLGLRMRVELDSSLRVAPGTVYAQRPASGSVVERGSVIELVGATSLSANEHAAGSVYLRPNRLVDVDGDGEGRDGWDVTLSRTSEGASLSFGSGAGGALLAAPGRLDASACERIRASSTSLPISEAARGQIVCVRTTAGRTTAIFFGSFQSEPPELLIRYSTLAARPIEPGSGVVAPPPPGRVVVAPPPPAGTRRPSTATCEQAAQGKIAWDYSGSKQWRQENLERLCRGASDDQPARCFDRIMHGGINWGRGTQWDSRNAIDLCEATTNADVTIGCFQRSLRAGNPWATAIAACDERRSGR